MSSVSTGPGTLGTPAPSANFAADSAASIRLLPFGFAERTNFDARQELQKTRSRHFTVPPEPQDNDIWRRLPPDFRPQAWVPRPPKRNSRDAVQPWRYRLESDTRYEAGGAERLPALMAPRQSQLHQSLEEQQHQQRPPRMQAQFRLMRPDTAKRRFVQEGVILKEPYAMPKPHDFRPYPPIQSLGLPQFTTAVDKDPYNIGFLTRNTDTIIGPLHEIRNIRDASGTMWSAVRLPPKWDPRLRLQQSSFPNKSCDYTRYRPRNRDPFEGFMDTVEAGLERRWQAEKLAGSAAAAAAAAADEAKVSA